MSRIAVILTAFFAAALVTPLVGRFAQKWGAVDRPDTAGAGRKLHAKTVPLLGGAAVYLALAVALVTAVAFGWLPGPNIPLKYIIGLLASAAILVVGGAYDDKYDLPPARQLVWPALATLVMVFCGVGVNAVSNPFGGAIELGNLAVLFTIVWLFGMTYTTKLLDGLDGLVSGSLVIGAIILAFVSESRLFAQYDTSLVALAVAGAFAGFLLWNFPPASIFLGEGGSTLAGFLLGALAIISGGKIATGLLVLGVPIFDTALVIIRRLVEKKHPWRGDRAHLHFRLLDHGYPPRMVLFLYWGATSLFGLATFFLQGDAKLLSLLTLATGLGVSTYLSLSRDKRPLQ